MLTALACPAPARDLDGRYAKQDPSLHEWFEGLRSGKGPCCSDADGSAISDADWKVQHKKLRDVPGQDGVLRAVYSDYAVVIDGNWIDVEPEAVITEPNRIGKTMVWPIRGYLGISIRCFMPGEMG
jgi:hypothetical protein